MPARFRSEIVLVLVGLCLKDAERLSNVILFESTGPNTTQIQSFEIGYTDSPELEQLMSFFIKANEGLLENLKAYLESGIRAEWGK